MNFGSSDWRNRRNFLNKGVPFSTMHYTITNYSTDVQMDKKIQMDEMKSPFAEDDLFNRFHSIPDPLKKNLADSVITREDKTKKTNKMSLDMQDFCYESDIEAEEVQKMPGPSRGDFYPTLTGIAGFFTNFIGAISGAMFHRRPKSPTAQYYDCFDQVAGDRRQASPRAWHMSKNQDQNKNGWAPEQFSTNDNMNNCRSAAAHCEDKLNVVRSLLTSKSVPIPPKTRLRRPRKQFVEAGSVEESFEDAFSPEDFVSLANEEYIEYFSVHNSQKQDFSEVDAPKVKTEVAAVRECTETVESLPKINSEKSPEVTEEIKVCTKIVKSVQENTENIPETIGESSVNVVNSNVDNNKEIISSCEDKMARLKSLLQEKRKKTSRTDLNSSDSANEPVKEKMVNERLKNSTNTVPTEKTQDKRFKNPHRLSKEKRKRCRQRKNIQEDMLFAHEIDSGEICSVENSPKCISLLHRNSEETANVMGPLALRRLEKNSDSGSVEDKEYFDEVKGRFHSSSTTESEDSFQIVFTDSPKLSRMRKPSDCESEDSFIVFEDSPDSCYTSNDVFGEQTEESECDSDSDSDVSDSGCAEVCKLSHSFSRTVSDLTDDSLYDDDRALRKKFDRLDSDELDCALSSVCEEVPAQEIKDLSEVEEIEVSEDKPVAKQGLLLDEARKKKKKDQPSKRVSFSEAPPTVRVMRVWAFAARQARAGHWERHALDRERFKRRIADVDMAVAWVLKPQHRSRVMFQRFMPWWNAQKRKELAEKKQREAEEKTKEAERIEKEEEEKHQEEADKSTADGAVVEVNVLDGKDISQVDVNSGSEISKDLDKAMNGEKVVIEAKANVSDAVLGKEITKNGNLKSPILNTIKDSRKGNNGVALNKKLNNLVFKSKQKNVIPNDKLLNSKVNVNVVK